MRSAFTLAVAGLALLGVRQPALAAPASPEARVRPNVVIVLADDMGWRDVGYQGSPEAKTPNLDRLGAEGVRFDAFYAAQQMCSPGRFAILTGRNPFRVGLHHLGAMRPQEITLARALREAGYRTAHFGKWHLGGGATHPLRMGFERSLYSANYFDTGSQLTVDDTREKRTVEGDSSVFLMDRALEWIRETSRGDAPFFAYVCFGSPHAPHVGSPEFKALYSGTRGRPDFLAEVSGVDAAVGRLRAALREMGISDRTLLWFTSDNGGITPASKDPAGHGKMEIGARTVACLEWPAGIPQPIRTALPCSHTDLYPTILEIAGVKVPGQPVLDGISLVPWLNGSTAERPRPIGFLSWDPPRTGGSNLAAADFVRDTGAVWLDGRFKLVVPPDGGDLPPAKARITTRLFDIVADPAERTDLAADDPARVASLRTALDEWRRSVRMGFDGGDYRP